MTISPLQSTAVTRLAGARLKELSVIEPARIARAIALSWAIIAAALVVALTTSYWGAVLALPIVSNRQYALMLLVHEASHGLFSRRRSLNDRVANWACAYPIGITVERYRELHLEHHRHLGTHDDPDFDYYGGVLTPGRLVRTIVAGALGVRGVVTVLFYFFPRLAVRYDSGFPDHHSSQTPSPSQLAGIAAAQVTLLVIFTLAGRPLLYVGVWLLPLLTLVPLVNQLRTLAEHASTDGSSVTRTVLASALGRVVLAPTLFFYHHEHHLYPSVPFYRLPELHRRLCEDGYFDGQPSLLAPSYVATLTALSHGEVPPPASAR